MRMPCFELMGAKPPKQPAKPLNLSTAPRVREFLEAFVALNGRKSVSSVVEEAVREFASKRGIDLDTPPEKILEAMISATKPKKNQR